ncbi:sensor histidine kinase [Frondihabitans peucedani]|uniref:Histidine kinase/HSP90-like ATPase domain-containing protein n=1 Tax=Frondihabitans peucedani TaxID=598626 RepID=A0ABP8E6K6_9MICO
MVGTLVVVGLLMALLTLPDFGIDHRPDRFPLLVLALCLAGLMVVALPLAILRRPGFPSAAGLWIPVGAYVGLLVLEPFIVQDPLPSGSTPWLLALSLIAFSCTAVAEQDPVRAGIICAGIDVALACAYAGRIPVSHTLVNLIGLGLLSGGLVLGMRALRLKADQADRDEREAQLLFEDEQRQLATEAERVRTDALLHDTVLAALLAAAGNQAPERATEMAEAALDIVSDTTDHPDAPPLSVLLQRLWSKADPELAPFRDTVQFDLAALSDVDLPPEVTEALISATVQALTNSINHAGPDAKRVVTATRLDDGGLRIVVSDDGTGFDLAAVPEARLGVRVSILERVRQVGGLARIDSAPGRGTTVTLEWPQQDDVAEVLRRPGESLFDVLPRRKLYRAFGVLIVVASVIATAEAVFVTHAYTSVIASLLGLSILPVLIRGARRGTMSNAAAWGTTAVGILLCHIATIGLDPADFDAASIARYTCGVLAGVVMAWMAGRRITPLITVGALVAQITLWAGPSGAIRLGLAAEIVIVIAGLLIHRALRRVSAAAGTAATRHRDLTIRKAELAAFNSERQRRLLHAGHAAAPILHRIIDTRGHLDEDARAECRVLEQALRDEIRGRNLLNNAVRRVVASHRRRGSLVQILDDGGLDGMAPATLDALLDQVAARLETVRSSRIVMRTGHAESQTAITLVASTPDETAAALGLDADDEVDLWLTIPHPDSVGLAA